MDVDPPAEKNIRQVGDLWYVVQVPHWDGVSNYGLHWDQLRSIFEYDDSIRHRRKTIKPMGYSEVQRAYEADHPNSLIRLADPNPNIANATIQPDAREYLGTQRPKLEDKSTGLNVFGKNLTEKQLETLWKMLWDSGEQVTYQNSRAAKSYKKRQTNRNMSDFARGPVADPSHRLPTVSEVTHPKRDCKRRATSTLAPYPIPRTPIASPLSEPTPVAGPSRTAFSPVAGPSQLPLPIPPLQPAIPIPTHSSILDEPILTDEDLAILTQELPADGIDVDADGEIDVGEEQSVVEIEVGADKGKGKEKEVDKPATD